MQIYCIDIGKIWHWIITRQISQIYNRVMARDLCQIFVSAHNLEYQLMDSDTLSIDIDNI